MNASTRTLALIALLIAAASATPARAAIWNGMSINGMSINGISLNGVGQSNGLTSNALTSNALHVNGVKPNGAGVNGLGTAAPCTVQSPCMQPAPQAAADDSAAPRFQGRSARPLGDVGAAATK